MTDSQRWMVIFGLVILAGLLYLLSPVLIPFLAAFLLAYFFNPLVNKFVKWHFPRVLAVTFVFLLFIVIVFGVVFLIIPILEGQIAILLKDVPAINKWLATVAWPWINTHFHIQEIDLSQIENTVLSYLDKSSGLLSKVWTTVSQSGMALIGFIISLGLVFVVSFYLLCDWNRVTCAILSLIPRRSEIKVIHAIKECGSVLAAFFRGQLLVMLSLSVIYAVGLWMIGLDVGILIGIVAGLLSIVPYLGFLVGIILAVVASLMQYHDWMHLVWVAVVFGVGEMAESFLLVPFLVGDRIGLHPVAVIFAVLAGGQLFGFLGVLLAVPVAAVIMVFLRRGRGHYVCSRYYKKLLEEE